MLVRVEIAVQDPVGARIAADAGADRVELCAALAATGGVTPSLSVVSACARVIESHVLVRLRPGGFVYSEEEISLMCADIRSVVAAGAAGVVVGAATRDGKLDELALAQLIDAAHGVDVTVHRVFDTVEDQFLALDICARLGVKRVLTSAGGTCAADEAAGLAALVRHASGVEIMAGGGVNPHNVDQVKGIGLAAVHGSCSTFIDCGPTGPGGKSRDQAVNTADAVQITHPGAVAALVAKVRAWG